MAITVRRGGYLGDAIDANYRAGFGEYGQRQQARKDALRQFYDQMRAQQRSQERSIQAAADQQERSINAQQQMAQFENMANIERAAMQGNLAAAQDLAQWKRQVAAGEMQHGYAKELRSLDEASRSRLMADELKYKLEDYKGKLAADGEQQRKAAMRTVENTMALASRGALDWGQASEVLSKHAGVLESTDLDSYVVPSIKDQIEGKLYERTDPATGKKTLLTIGKDGVPMAPRGMPKAVEEYDPFSMESQAQQFKIQQDRAAKVAAYALQLFQQMNEEYDADGKVLRKTRIYPSMAEAEAAAEKKFPLPAFMQPVDPSQGQWMRPHRRGPATPAYPAGEPPVPQAQPAPGRPGLDTVAPATSPPIDVASLEEAEAMGLEPGVVIRLPDGTTVVKTPD